MSEPLVARIGALREELTRLDARRDEIVTELRDAAEALMPPRSQRPTKGASVVVREALNTGGDVTTYSVARRLIDAGFSEHSATMTASRLLRIATLEGVVERVRHGVFRAVGATRNGATA